MNTYKHSGTLGDLIYSLPIVKHTGGGKFYLHLNQIDWIGKHYYGAEPNPFHQGRMTMKDFLFMEPFMKAQRYITGFEPLDPRTAEISHNLDKFRAPFVGHPGNYVDIFASCFGINDPTEQMLLRTTPWITVPETKTVEGKNIVINRTSRWLPGEKNPVWAQWVEDGVIADAIFIGLPEEHKAFEQFIGTSIDYQPTKDLLEVAQYIAGADKFIGNQSVALSIAIGLGKEYYCEARRDLPIERNECYFPAQPNGSYF